MATFTGTGWLPNGDLLLTFASDDFKINVSFAMSAEAAVEMARNIAAKYPTGSRLPERSEVNKGTHS